MCYKINCAIFRPSHAPWRSLVPSGHPEGGPDPSARVAASGGGDRHAVRPSVTTHRTPHAARRVPPDTVCAIGFGQPRLEERPTREREENKNTP